MSLVVPGLKVGLSRDDLTMRAGVLLLAGALLVSSARAVQQGLRFRTLDTTVRDTLDWFNKRPADERKLAVGLTPEREAELLKLLSAKQG